jgi:hypothetical protein
MSGVSSTYDVDQGDKRTVAGKGRVGSRDDPAAEEEKEEEG